MKPSKIFDILDLAMEIRDQGNVFNPLFVGAPGLGKSQIVQEWANKRNLPFIDLRAAYLEAPDVIGFPSIETVNGKQLTVHNTPNFWPQDPNSKGVLLLEEPNRGTTSIMNTFMQLLTDRKVHHYALPKGWIIVGCINPEGEEYDVNTMDAALKDRFETFEVSYDKGSLLSYMKEKQWDQHIIMFIESNTWQYKLPEEIGDTPGAKYISPRTFSKLNSIRKASVHQDDELMLFQTILGNNVGKAFYQFVHDQAPVLFTDLVKSPKRSLKKLEQYSDPNGGKSGMISITIQDIVETNKIEDELLVEVLKVIPVDQGTVLVRDLEYKRKDDTILVRICKSYPEIHELFRSVLRVNKK